MSMVVLASTITIELEDYVLKIQSFCPLSSQAGEIIPGTWQLFCRLVLLILGVIRDPDFVTHVTCITSY